MPEPPDFETIARWMAMEAGHTGQGAITSMIEEQLRQVWNARGAADLRTLGDAFAEADHELMTVADALRRLDR